MCTDSTNKFLDNEAEGGRDSDDEEEEEELEEDREMFSNKRDFDLRMNSGRQSE